MLIFCVNIRAEKSLTYCKTLFYKMITYGAYVSASRISFCYMVGSGNFSRHLQCLSRDKVHDRGGLNALKYRADSFLFNI